MERKGDTLPLITDTQEKGEEEEEEVTQEVEAADTGRQHMSSLPLPLPITCVSPPPFEEVGRHDLQ